MADAAGSRKDNWSLFCPTGEGVICWEREGVIVCGCLWVGVAYVLLMRFNDICCITDLRVMV